MSSRGAGARGAGSFSQRVYRMVSRVPYGRVSTYGDIAALLGHPRAARGVGQALSRLPAGTDVPWWRVVNRAGELSIPAPDRPLQRVLLVQEGVRFRTGGGADLRRHRWNPDGRLGGRPRLAATPRAETSPEREP